MTSAADLVIPPNTDSLTIRGYCTADCTRQLPRRGIQVYAGFPHTHLAGERTISYFQTAAHCARFFVFVLFAGRKVRIGLVRNGVEIKPIVSDEHYDFNLQSMQTYEPTTILPVNSN